MNRIRQYYQLTKPGIIRGNAITAIAGFLLASQGNVKLDLFAAMLIGLSLIIASACVFNNYMDRGIDATMARTKNRALVTGTIKGTDALIFATLLGLAGAAILGLFTNALTLMIALFGMFAYVFLYGVGKRRSVHGTEIGSVSGAIPPVVGYTAVSNTIDTAAIILFLILVLWQMPHFYAIAMYRLKDYKAASIPVLPLKKGMLTAKIFILVYIVGFTGAATLLTVFGYTGMTYLAGAILLGSIWFGIGVKKLEDGNDTTWAKTMFLLSMLVLTLLSILISLDSFLV